MNDKRLFQYSSNLYCKSRNGSDDLQLCICAKDIKEAKRIASKINPKMRIFGRVKGTTSFRECYYQIQIEHAKRNLENGRFLIKEIKE